MGSKEVLEQFEADFKQKRSADVPKITIEDIVIDGGPFTFWVPPINTVERNKIESKQGLARAAMNIIVRCHDENGERIFGDGQLSELMRCTDSRLVMKISALIWKSEDLLSPEQWAGK